MFEYGVFPANGEVLAAAYFQVNCPVASPCGDSNVLPRQRPLLGCLKFNCGDAFRPAAFGVVIHNQNGVVVEVNFGRMRVPALWKWRSGLLRWVHFLGLCKRQFMILTFMLIRSNISLQGSCFTLKFLKLGPSGLF